MFDVEEFRRTAAACGSLRNGRDTWPHEGTRACPSFSLRGGSRHPHPGFYQNFQGEAERVKDDLLLLLIDAKRRGLKVGAYGAAAKGSTLLNFAGIRPDLLPYVVDKNPAKQGRYMPGSHIPIVPESHLQTHRPDCILILPWNLREEVMAQLAYVREWGGIFVVAIPRLCCTKG